MAQKITPVSNITTLAESQMTGKKPTLEELLMNMPKKNSQGYSDALAQVLIERDAEAKAQMEQQNKLLLDRLNLEAQKANVYANSDPLMNTDLSPILGAISPQVAKTYQAPKIETVDENLGLNVNKLARETAKEANADRVNALKILLENSRISEDKKADRDLKYMLMNMKKGGSVGGETDRRSLNDLDKRFKKTDDDLSKVESDIATVKEVFFQKDENGNYIKPKLAQAKNIVSKLARSLGETGALAQSDADRALVTNLKDKYNSAAQFIGLNEDAELSDLALETTRANLEKIINKASDNLYNRAEKVAEKEAKNPFHSDYMREGMYGDEIKKGIQSRINNLRISDKKENVIDNNSILQMIQKNNEEINKLKGGQ